MTEQDASTTTHEIMTTLSGAEIAVLRAAYKAWRGDKDQNPDWADNQFGWRRTERLEPDMWLVFDWQKALDEGWLECDSTHPDSYAQDAEFRITQFGRDMLEAIDKVTPKQDIEAAVENAYAKGRADSERDLQRLVVQTLSRRMGWLDDNAAPVKTLLREVEHMLGAQESRRKQLQTSLETRDKVDEWAAHLLDLAADIHVANHGERRGHMTMVAAMLRFYVGSRNPLPEPPEPDGIPF